MSPEVWFRNPLTYIREVAELFVPNVIWDRGFALKYRVDPQKFMEMHVPGLIDYRILMCGEQGTAELRRGYSMSDPYAVYPTWEYGEHSMGDLERLLKYQTIPKGPYPDTVGRPGQENRVVIIRAPNASTDLGKAFLEVLKELQFEYPDAIIHYHGSYSWRVMFSYGLRSIDVDPIAWSAKGKIVLGNGKIIQVEDANKHQQWINLNGFSVDDIAVARNRTMFCMKSALWAGHNWNSTDTWRVRPGAGLPDVDPYAVVAAPIPSRDPFKGNPQPGDKFLCDQCSLFPTCKYARVGGVCAIPDTEGSGLARHFKTRDSEQIITGLGRVLEKQIERAERGMESEKLKPVGEDLDPEVTKILKNIFDSGVKLAKLVNPSLNGGPKVGVFINGTDAKEIAVTENALVSAVIAELEAQGINRADIDAEMVTQYLVNKNRAAIEATSHDT